MIVPLLFWKDILEKKCRNYEGSVFEEMEKYLVDCVLLCSGLGVETVEVVCDGIVDEAVERSGVGSMKVV